MSPLATIRSRSLRLSFVSGFLPLLACTVFAPPTHVVVLRTTSADRALREEGTNLAVHHWALEPPQLGIERGFFVVKSDLEWHHHWANTETEKVPLLPANLSFGKEMLLIAAPNDRDAVATEVRTVIVTEDAVHVYLTETVPGVDCPLPEKDRTNYDLARVPLVETKRISVIDFKSGRVPPGESAIPGSHRAQMAAYAEALKVIFPGREIRAALLYTAGPTLFELGA